MVDLLKCFQSSPAAGGGSGEQEDLSDGQAHILQSFVNSLQSFSAGMGAGSPAGGSPFRERAQQPLITPPTADSAAAGAPPRTATVFVDLVAKEMEEIMALHEAGLLDLDGDDPVFELETVAPSSIPVAAASAEPSHQSVIDAEVLALNALMQSGWWDEPSTASKDAKANQPEQT